MAEKGSVAPRLALETLAGILSREVHSLAQRPDLLWQQLQNRLQWVDEAVRHTIDQGGSAEDRARAGPWLRTTRPFNESRAFQFSLVGHEGPVSACAVTPDGQRILSAGTDDTLKVWDAATGRELLTIHTEQHGLFDCSVALDSRLVATAGRDGTVKVWDLRTEGLVAVLERHDGPVHSCALSPDGRRVVSASQDTTLGVWRVANPQRLWTLEGHKGPVNVCALTPDGLRIVSGGGGSVPGSARMRGRAALRAVSAMQRGELSEEHDTGRDYALRVWDVVTGKQRGTLEGHRSGISDCAMSPDGALVVSVASDGLRVWDLDSGKEIRKIESPSGSFRSCAVSPDGSSVAVGIRGANVELWDVRSNRLIRTLHGHAATACAMTPSGRFLVSAGQDTTLRVWDLDAEADPEQDPDSYRSIVISCATIPGGSRAVLASGERNTLHAWDIDGEGHPDPLTEDGHEAGIQGCAVSPDGSFVVSAGLDGIAKAWDPSTGTELQSFTGHQVAVMGCAVGPDGTTVLSCGADRTVRAWSVRGGEEIVAFHGHTAPVETCAVGTDGAVALSGGDDGALRAWDLRTGESLGEVVEDVGQVLCCAVSPDGRFFVSVGGRPQQSHFGIWEYPTREPRFHPSAGRGGIKGCAISPDGALVATAGVDHAVRLWDAVSGEEIAALFLPSAVYTVAFHPSRVTLVCGGLDGPQIVEAVGCEYGPLATAVLEVDGVLEARCPACLKGFAVEREALEGEAICTACRRPLRLNSFAVTRRGPSAASIHAPAERELDAAVRALGLPPQGDLGGLFQRTDLSVEWIDAGVFQVSVPGAVGRRGGVQAREHEDGNVWLIAPLPELPKRRGRGKAIELLLKVSFLVHYVRPALLDEGQLKLIAILPLHLLEPRLLEGIILGMAELADVDDSSDLDSAKGWNRRAEEAARVMSRAAELDPVAEREKLMAMDTGIVPDQQRPEFLTFVAQIGIRDMNGRQLDMAITPWIATSRGSISFICVLPWMPKDMVQEGEHILRTNASQSVARLTLYPNNQVTVIYSVPKVETYTKDAALQGVMDMVARGAMPLGKM